MKLTLCVAAIFLLSSAVSSHTQAHDVALSINGPRPLAEAASQLESKVGIAISYEDVALIYSGDYARALDTDWGRKYGERDARFRANNPIGSRGGSLEIQFATDPVSDTPVIPVSQTLQALIDQHKARGNPGQFQLLTINDSLVIIPVMKRDTAGTLVPEHSPLDSQISFPVERRSGMETLEIICRTVTTASGRNVHPGTLSLNFFFQTAVELGADHETARNVLMRALRDLRWADGRKFPEPPKMWAWRLLYGPNRAMTTPPTLADGSYALNLNSIQ